MTQITIPSGLHIAYDTFGSPDHPALLLVMGYASQMVSWQVGFCQMLAASGLYVIRYDNRDVGLSSKCPGQTYTLSDMAEDGMGLLTALGIAHAHVMGASLGGMIAQTMAMEHPKRVLSLISMMSNTGEVEYGRADPKAYAAMLAPRPLDRAGYIAAAEMALVWSSRKYPDVAAMQAQAAQAWDRGLYPEGAPRQLAAARSGGSRTQGLRQLQVPTLVIHGLDDTLITPSGGERTAELVPGAKLLLVEHMGHDRPEPLWPVLCDAVIEHIRGVTNTATNTASTASTASASG